MPLSRQVRYGDKDFKHPYKPWADAGDADGRHFRAFKAFQNCVEWTVLTLPVLWLFTLYISAVPVHEFAAKIPVVANAIKPFKPAVHGPWAGCILALAWAKFNADYVPAYAKSAEARLEPFKNRTMAFRILFYGAAGTRAPPSSAHDLRQSPQAPASRPFAAGIACTAARAYGIKF